MAAGLDWTGFRLTQPTTKGTEMPESDAAQLANLLVGFMAGATTAWMAMLAYKDREYDRMNEAQRKRGDYWFDKYMREVQDDWVPLSDDFDE